MTPLYRNDVGMHVQLDENEALTFSEAPRSLLPEAKELCESAFGFEKHDGTRLVFVLNNADAAILGVYEWDTDTTDWLMCRNIPPGTDRWMVSG